MLLPMLARCLLALPGVAPQPEPKWVAPTAPADAGPEPRWVWHAPPGRPAPTTSSAEQGPVRLAKAFEAPGGVRAGVLAAAADNAALVFLNGEPVLEVSDWAAPVMREVELRPGRNVLAVAARNDPGAGANPAGFVARLRLELADGSTQWVVTDATWTGAAEAWPGFPAAEPPAGDPVTDLGPASTPPWSLAPTAFDPSPPCPLLRREFDLPAAPTRATVRVIGLGHYRLTCNGQPVGDSVLDQAWSQYDRTLYWQEFDLAPHLRAGRNVLGVALGNSFWQVAAANHPRRFTKTDAMPDFSGGRPHLLWLDASVTAGGVEQRLVSDASWKWSPGPATFSNIYAGEDFDARLARPGWDAPGFDDSAWAAAAEVPAPAGEPTPLIGPPMRRFEVFRPVEVRRLEPGVCTYIFPQNCSALLRFTLDGGAPGSPVRFKPCEYADESGRVKFTYTWGTGKDIWLDYTKATAGPETHEAVFFYVGAQFVQVEGAVPGGDANPAGLPVVRSIELVHVRAACPTAGSFGSSSPVHDAAHRLVDWAIRSNMSHVPTDCPHREKNGWQEQNWHMARALSYRYDTLDWMRRNMRAVRDAQTSGGGDDGFVPTNTPWYLVGRPRHDMVNDAPEWGVSAVLVPWHLYEWYGDAGVLRDNYDAARRFVDYLTRTARDGVITSNLGDWYDFGHGQGNGPSRWTPNEVSATVVWALAASTLARWAEALDKPEEAAEHRALFERVRADFQRRFYDPATSTVRHNGSCQAGTSAALVAGLIPQADRPAALDAVVADLERRGWAQTPGEVLQVFLIRALAEGGRGDVLHRVYNRDDIPSYGHMVKTGLTTLPESWDARRGTGDSLNHFMLGHLVEWHFAYVAGIRQDEGSVGWQRVLIAPQPPPPGDASPNALRSAAAEFRGPRGVIASRWEIADGEFRLTCTVPPGVTAAAVMPDGSRRPLGPGTTALRQPRR